MYKDKRSAIYKITCLINNKIYIGSAKIVQYRKHQHFVDLKNNKHCNKKLQRSYNKYGKENFIFEILEFVEDKSKLIEREQFYLDTILFAQQFINKENDLFNILGFNLKPIAGNSLFFKHKAKSILLMQKNRKGKLKNVNKPTAHRKKISQSLKKSEKLKKLVNSIEWRNKQSLSQKNSIKNVKITCDCCGLKFNRRNYAIHYSKCSKIDKNSYTIAFINNTGRVVYKK